MPTDPYGTQSPSTSPSTTAQAVAAQAVMPLPGTVCSAPSGLRGFDSDTVISHRTAGQFVGEGYRFCLRYLPHAGGGTAGCLTAQEANDILTAGLALMPVQHVRKAPWSPDGPLGQSDGAYAAAYARSVGFPVGVNVWCDLEGVDGQSSAQDVIDYCNEWYDAVSQAGYVPGLYVGANAGLSGQQLYSNLQFQHYWKSCSAVPALPERGYQMVQTLVPGTVNGIGIDRDITQTDGAGGKAQWLAVSGS
ncbi:DUF1906 domain-containing protein [Dyella subtropica]|uniref:DUF1906 domain-containing protein n=1 Tax=Dyella subtropica TaxID=2992127 RepID=UPI002254AE1F|nr:DUF1906 domain-containing protein [Dyella subtropica]